MPEFTHDSVMFGVSQMQLFPIVQKNFCQVLLKIQFLFSGRYITVVSPGIIFVRSFFSSSPDVLG